MKTVPLEGYVGRGPTDPITTHIQSALHYNIILDSTFRINVDHIAVKRLLRHRKRSWLTARNSDLINKKKITKAINIIADKKSRRRRKIKDIA